MSDILTRPVMSLVNMPYAQLATPSVAVGLLKAKLDAANLPTRVLDAQILFAERIGPGFYSFLIAGFSYLIGEWTFSGSAFPDFKPDNDLFLETIALTMRPKNRAGLIERLWQTRAAAARFVDDMAERILDTHPHIVGCTSVFQQHCAALALLRRIKALDASVITVIGGSNCESDMGRTALVSFPWLDVVVSGEADDLIAPLCQMLLDEGPELAVERLPAGVFAHDHRRRWLAGEDLKAGRHVLDNIDVLPIPDYDTYYDTLSGSPVAPAIVPGLPIETSRGCWWGQRTHCTFCGIESGSMRFRSKSAARVLDEMEALYRRYHIPRFKVVDLILDLHYFKDLLPHLAVADQGFKLFFEVKANLSREQIRLLRQAGVVWIQPGFESLHDGPLKLTRKGTSVAINLQTLKWAREEGICTLWTILTEVPGEEPLWYVEMAEMIEHLVHLQPPMGWNVLEYDRFSPYHTAPEHFGLKLVASWMHYFVYPLDPVAMQGIAYRFQDVKHVDLTPHERPPIPGVEMPRTLSDEAMQLLHAINRWQGLFWSRTPAILRLTDGGDHSTIFDTRPCAPAEHVTLEGLAHQIYRTCDAARGRAFIVQEIARANGCAPDPYDVETVLQDLVARKLMLEVSGRFLALATLGNVPDLPPGREFPDGFVASHMDEQILAARQTGDQGGRKRPPRSFAELLRHR